MAHIVIDAGPQTAAQHRQQPPQQQNMTPPGSATNFDEDGLLHPLHSASTTASYYPRDQDWSPGSADTHLTTPPRSPHRIRDCGPLLLPRVRTQDQVLEPVMPGMSQFGHARTASLPGSAYAVTRQFGGHLQKPETLQIDVKGSVIRSDHAARSPSVVSPLHHMINDAASIARQQSNISHSRNGSSSRAHARNSSSSSIDASMLSRYGYPTYRHAPQPPPLSAGPTLVQAGGPGATYVTASHPRPSCAMSHLTPISMPNGHLQPFPPSVRARSRSPTALQVPSHPPQPQPPSPALAVPVTPCTPCTPTLDHLQTSTALEYLTAPNPTPCLTRRTVDVIRGQHTHFWYDVRNVCEWKDFKVATIAAAPSVLPLLHVPVDIQHLPTPSRVNLSPETASQLAELCAGHHAVKVNAALRLTQGPHHLSMRALRPSLAHARQQPEFISSYLANDDQHTPHHPHAIFGDPVRGRVVGIVKCYDQWNSGMRNGEAPDKVKYLHGLAQLHRFMREHGTRYGFVMTEIELVCVRAGGPPSSRPSHSTSTSTSAMTGVTGPGAPKIAAAAAAAAAAASQPPPNVPLFGFLEVARSVNISASGPDQNGNLQMTAGLALWWLHMLAREQPMPMPGQLHWQMDVGPPAARSRQFHLPRDAWMPPAIGLDMREAKRVRGWVWPHEPLSKRELGKARKARR